MSVRAFIRSGRHDVLFGQELLFKEAEERVKGNERTHAAGASGVVQIAERFGVAAGATVISREQAQDTVGRLGRAQRAIMLYPGKEICHLGAHGFVGLWCVGIGFQAFVERVCGGVRLFCAAQSQQIFQRKTGERGSQNLREGNIAVGIVNNPQEIDKIGHVSAVQDILASLGGVQFIRARGNAHFGQRAAIDRKCAFGAHENGDVAGADHVSVGERFTRAEKCGDAIGYVCGLDLCGGRSALTFGFSTITVILATFLVGFCGLGQNGDFNGGGYVFVMRRLFGKA